MGNENKNTFLETATVPTPDAEKVINVETIDPVTLDGKLIPSGMTVKVSVKQWRALSKHMKWVSGPEKHNPENDTFAKRSEARQDREGRTIDDIVADAVAKALKAAPKAAALIAFALFLFLTSPAKAVGPPSQFGILPVPTQLGFVPTNGNTFGLTNVGCGATTTNVWVAQNNTAGIPTNVITLTKFDEMFVTLTGQAQSGTSGFTNTWTLCQGDGLGYWDTNHPVAVLALGTPSGVNAVLCTNLSRNVLGSAGYFIWYSIGNITSATPGTNLAQRIQVKPIRNGN
jgi:hypothetical protein